MAGFSITHLNKSFTIDGTSRSVLNNLCLQGNTDDITVILGRSGCGKTTLLRILSGLEKADSGTFDFPGTSDIAMVFQEPALMPWLPVTKNIAFGIPRKNVDMVAITRLISLVGLDGFASAYPNQLSGGMQHRVALARALARQPALVLMDEPFSALDYFTREAMQREVLRIHRETKMGAIFVTHNIDEAILLGDHIYIMSNGAFSHVFHQTSGALWRDLLSDESTELKRHILAGLNSQLSGEIKEK